MDNALKESFNAPSQYQVEAFMQAAARGDISGVTAFLEKYASAIDARDDFNRSALLWASACGQREAAALLIDRGADINLQEKLTNDADFTALMHAAYQGHADVVELLLEEGADADMRDSGFDSTALELAKGSSLIKEEKRGKIIALLGRAPEIRRQRFLEETDCSRGLSRAMPVPRPLGSMKL